MRTISLFLRRVEVSGQPLAARFGTFDAYSCCVFWRLFCQNDYQKNDKSIWLRELDEYNPLIDFFGGWQLKRVVSETQHHRHMQSITQVLALTDTSSG